MNKFIFTVHTDYRMNGRCFYETTKIEANTKDEAKAIHRANILAKYPDIEMGRQSARISH